MTLHLDIDKNILTTKFSAEEIGKTKATKYLSDVQIKKIALFAVSAFAFLSGIAAFVLSLTGVIPAAFGIFAGLSLCLAGALAIGGTAAIKDYTNPFQLEKMRNQALGMSYSQLIQKHGLRNIHKYKIVSPEFLREKKHFENFTSSINLKYQNRQENLLKQLDGKEKTARNEAAKRKDELTWAAWFAIEEENALHPERRAVGGTKKTVNLSLEQIQLAQRPAYEWSEKLLRDKLSKIQAERDQIIRQQTGKPDQEAYDAQMKAARISHEQNMAEIIARDVQNESLADQRVFKSRV